MLIPEAVQLVLQAAAIGQPGGALRARHGPADQAGGPGAQPDSPVRSRPGRRDPDRLHGTAAGREALGGAGRATTRSSRRRRSTRFCRCARRRAVGRLTPRVGGIDAARPGRDGWRRRCGGAGDRTHRAGLPSRRRSEDRRAVATAPRRAPRATVAASSSIDAAAPALSASAVTVTRAGRAARARGMSG